jgi:hypothetical protein
MQAMPGLLDNGGVPRCPADGMCPFEIKTDVSDDFQLHCSSRARGCTDNHVCGSVRARARMCVCVYDGWNAVELQRLRQWWAAAFLLPQQYPRRRRHREH